MLKKSISIIEYLNSLPVEWVADLNKIARDKADNVLLVGIVRVARRDRDEVVFNFNACDDRCISYRLNIFSWDICNRRQGISVEIPI